MMPLSALGLGTRFRLGAALSAALCTATLFTSARVPAASSKSTTLYDFTAVDIDGKEVQLSSFKASPVALVVNVASE